MRKPDPFSVAVNNNPIDKKMSKELMEEDISGLTENMMFYDGYLKIWKDELEFSINNIEKYLQADDVLKLKEANSCWEASLKSPTSN